MSRELPYEPSWRLNWKTAISETVFKNATPREQRKWNDHRSERANWVETRGATRAPAPGVISDKISDLSNSNIPYTACKIPILVSACSLRLATNPLACASYVDCKKKAKFSIAVVTCQQCHPNPVYKITENKHREGRCCCIYAISDDWECRACFAFCSWTKYAISENKHLKP